MELQTMTLMDAPKYDAVRERRHKREFSARVRDVI